MKKLIKIIAGYLLIYASLEAAAHITGNPGKTENSLIICVVVVIIAILVEVLGFKRNFKEALNYLGFGKPSITSIVYTAMICFLLFACYPLITAITSYSFKIPENWIWLAVGVFALHGIAEEAAFRGFLFHHLRYGRNFWKAVWLSVLFFSVTHIPIIINNGILVGGAALLLSVASSFPFAYMFEKGNNTIWAPAMLHFSIDTIIPILSAGEFNQTAQSASMIWMFLCITIPYLIFLVPKKCFISKKLKK